MMKNCQIFRKREFVDYADIKYSGHVREADCICSCWRCSSGFLLAHFSSAHGTVLNLKCSRKMKAECLPRNSSNRIQACLWSRSLINVETAGNTTYDLWITLFDVINVFSRHRHKCTHRIDPRQIRHRDKTLTPIKNDSNFLGDER